MNRGRHMSYQCRIGNMKGDSSTVRSRPWLDYMMPLQCLSYKGPKGEEQKKKNYSGRFPYLQGHLIPQAGYMNGIVIPNILAIGSRKRMPSTKASMIWDTLIWSLLHQPRHNWKNQPKHDNVQNPLAPNLANTGPQ